MDTPIGNLFATSAEPSGVVAAGEASIGILIPAGITANSRWSSASDDPRDAIAHPTSSFDAAEVAHPAESPLGRFSVAHTLPVDRTQTICWLLI